MARCSLPRDRLKSGHLCVGDRTMLDSCRSQAEGLTGSSAPTVPRCSHTIALESGSGCFRARVAELGYAGALKASGLQGPCGFDSHPGHHCSCHEDPDNLWGSKPFPNAGEMTRSGSEGWRRRPDSNRGVGVLQTPALPLGYAALIGRILERETGLEPATFSLARRRSTTELLPLGPNAGCLPALPECSLPSIILTPPKG